MSVNLRKGFPRYNRHREGNGLRPIYEIIKLKASVLVESSKTVRMLSLESLRDAA